MSDIRAIYERIGADFDDVASRLGSPALVERFAGKFVQDDSFSQLEDALAAHDAKAAFRAAHTLKGVAQNLGFDRLYAVSVPLTEAMRGAKPLDDFSLLAAVQAVQTETLAAIAKLDDAP